MVTVAATCMVPVAGESATGILSLRAVSTTVAGSHLRPTMCHEAPVSTNIWSGIILNRSSTRGDAGAATATPLASRRKADFCRLLSHTLAVEPGIIRRRAGSFPAKRNHLTCTWSLKTTALQGSSRLAAASAVLLVGPPLAAATNSNLKVSINEPNDEQTSGTAHATIHSA